ncbi:hypothetical protein N7G274_007388 [Stereocaulon virgatum]|uniref:Uncharacterized protein n=1 Tax=Stereocaulon virgatum TaxID=373712 RepID=A0ABR4A3G6_9LECA
MLSTSRVWLHLSLLSGTIITAEVLAITNPLQSQPSFNNETSNTAALQKSAPDRFFTSAQNVSTGGSVSYSLSQRPNFNGSIARFTEFVRYDVVDSNPPLELDFHSFGSVLPDGQGIDTVTAALTSILPFILSRRGSLAITAGIFQFTQQFSNGDNVTFSVGDFRELSQRKSVTYYVLADTLKGLREFVRLERAQKWSEVSFELELPKKKGGYVGSGYLSRRPGQGGPTATGLVETS